MNGDRGYGKAISGTVLKNWNGTGRLNLEELKESRDLELTYMFPGKSSIQVPDIAC